MARTRVKICGVTSPDDAAAAAEAGADAVGVVFATSPRRVERGGARDILAALPARVTRVGVFVDATPDSVREAVEVAGLDNVQFHGDETPAECRGAPVPVVKAFRVGDGFDGGAFEAYRGAVAGLLLDTFDADAPGGTGRSFDWHGFGTPPSWAHVIVAGGLAAENVGDVIRTFRPYAVDVCSGVEASPGRKDPARMREFVRAVRRADTEARE